MSPPAAAASVSSLSDAQRAYLRMVSEGLTSKQIAHAIGGSHHTVNAEIAIAMRLLGAKSRQQAAAMLARSDGIGSYEPSYEPPAIAVPPPAIANDVPGEGGDGGPAWPWPTRNRPENTLSGWQRFAWVVGLAATIALLLGGLASGVTALLVSVGRWI